MLLVPFSQGGKTALMMASEKGHPEVVRALLNAGANKEAKAQVSATRKGEGSMGSIGRIGEPRN